MSISCAEMMVRWLEREVVAREHLQWRPWVVLASCSRKIARCPSFCGHGAWAPPSV